jgi:inner membrane protein
MQFNTDIKTVYLTASVIGSLLPDIDEPKSYIGSKSKSTSFFIKFFFGHRGITHSILFISIFHLLLFILFKYKNINISILYLFTIGYFSHLAVDFITKGGIPLLYPNEKRYKIPIFKVSGFLETIFRYFLYYIFFGLVKF